MSKAASATEKGTSLSKKTTAGKSRARTTVNTDSLTPSRPLPEVDAFATILQRLEALEGKISGGFSVLAEEIRTMKATAPVAPTESEASPEALPLLTDALRRNLLEHMTPITAALKRLEERIGFVANRLKHGGGSGGGGQDRQKPWRHEQGRHPRSQRGQQNGQPRPTQGQPQQWTPPSAASVQGHFAPRPLPGGGFAEEED